MVKIILNNLGFPFRDYCQNTGRGLFQYLLRKIHAGKNLFNKFLAYVAKNSKNKHTLKFKTKLKRY